MLSRNDAEETTNEHQWARIRSGGNEVCRENFCPLFGERRLGRLERVKLLFLFVWIRVHSWLNCLSSAKEITPWQSLDSPGNLFAQKRRKRHLCVNSVDQFLPMKSFVIFVFVIAASGWLVRWMFYRLAKACAEDYTEAPGDRYSKVAKRDLN